MNAKKINVVIIDDPFLARTFQMLFRDNPTARELGIKFEFTILPIDLDFQHRTEKMALPTADIALIEIRLNGSGKLDLHNAVSYGVPTIATSNWFDADSYKYETGTFQLVEKTPVINLPVFHKAMSAILETIVESRTLVQPALVAQLPEYQEHELEEAHAG